MRQHALTPLADLSRDDADRVLDLLTALPAGADDLARVEEEYRGLGFLQPVDETRELVGLVLRSVETECDRLQVKLVGERRGGDHVLDPNLQHGPDPKGLKEALKGSPRSPGRV